MRAWATAAVQAAFCLLPFSASALNIIVTNDDGFGSANIREFYRLLNAAGHNGAHVGTHVLMN